MSIYQAIGMAWVIFTSALANIAILYLAFIGLKALLASRLEADREIPVGVKEMFKIGH